MKDIDPNAIEHLEELAEERFPVASKEKSIPHPLDKLHLLHNGKRTEKLTIDELKKKHSSYPRNELIAKVFFLAGFIDAWESGTIRMMTECKKAGLPEPVYKEAGGGMQVTFLKDIYTEEYLQKMGLNERQIKAVLYVKENGSIVNAIYQKINSTTKPTATRDLRELIDKGITHRKGVTERGTKYVLK